MRAAVRLATVIVLLGFLVGDSLADQEPDLVVPMATRSASPVSPVESNYPVPYADSPQPVSVRIPALDIAASIQPVGMSDASTMQVPTDISMVGWFDDSVLPISETGHTVLVGHRDGHSDPNGVFRNLGELRRGDPIKLRDLAGRKLQYLVTDVTVLSDDAFARKAYQIFRTDGPHRLMLITCGGAYDATRGGYQANVVVVATPT